MDRISKTQLSLSLRLLIALFFTLFFAAGIFGQQSFVFSEGNVLYNKAMDLFHKEKYVAAQEHFKKTIEGINDVHSEIRIDAEYYRAICALRLFHANSEALLNRFVEDHPESSHQKMANFNLAKFQFRKRKYEKVISAFKEIDPLDLKPVEMAEYYFKLGYSYFQLDEFDEAAKYFYEIKDSDNLYVSAARYYYAHISYQQKNYQTASENFQKISNNPQFGPLVPYYLTQIFYLQKKYDKLLDYAPAVLDSAPPKREDEIRKLIGDAYYKTKEYKKSLPYLEKSLQTQGGNEADYYQLGFAHFQEKNYNQAIASFQKSIGENDTLSQSAYYYIGESSVLTENKRSAKDAFRQAHQLGIDPELTEDALFNYAKVAYELSYHPYDDAIVAFEEFINEYPNSPLLKDAYEFLVGVYYTTKNYESALESIDRIKSSDIKLLRAKQRLAYYRGIELFNEDRFLAASEKLELSLKYNYDPKLKASAIFWLAECFYQIGDYHNADNFYSDFLMTSGSLSLPFYNRAYYNLAYSYYEREKYKSAIFWFREFVSKEDPSFKGLINDAYLRIGDSYYIQTDYRNAIEYYDKAAEMKIVNQDYAMLQSAICSGIIGDQQSKTKKLGNIVREMKQSPYVDDAVYELGKTQLNEGRAEEALSYFNQLIADYPNSNYVAETYLRLGLIYYNREQDELALNALDKLIKNYPSSDASKEALEKINKIFIDKGDAKAYEDYIAGVPFADLSKAVLDSTTYVIAENGYLAGKCEKATRDFTNYIKQYPNGRYRLNAHFYRGECEAKANFYEEAIRDLQYVIEQKTNRFTVKSHLLLGQLYTDAQLPDSAISIYKALKVKADRQEYINTANLNLMKLYFQKEEYEFASLYADEVLLEDAFSQQSTQFARMILAKSNFEKENYKAVIEQLSEIYNETNQIAAEAKYLLAKTYYLQGKYEASDTVIYQLVDQVPSYPHWIAKGFILLADNFIAKDDIYNARITFQSVIDNSDDKMLIEIAQEKLSMLDKAEKEQRENQLEKRRSDTLEIDLGAEQPVIEENEENEVKEDSIQPVEDENE